MMMRRGDMSIGRDDTYGGLLRVHRDVRLFTVTPGINEGNLFRERVKEMYGRTCVDALIERFYDILRFLKSEYVNERWV